MGWAVFGKGCGGLGSKLDEQNQFLKTGTFHTNPKLTHLSSAALHYPLSLLPGLTPIFSTTSHLPGSPAGPRVGLPRAHASGR